MKFLSETERMEHLQARLIPHTLWIQLFHKTLSNAQLALMQATDADLMSQSKLISLLEPIARYSWIDTKCAWLAIALTHPCINDEVLQDVATQLKLPANELLNLAIIFGNSRFFEKIIGGYVEPEQQTKMLKNNKFAVFNWALTTGNLEAFDRLLTLAETNQIPMIDILQSDYRDHDNALYWAAKSGNIEGFDRVVQLARKHHMRIKDMLYCTYDTYSLNALSCAVLSGNIEMINHVVKLAKDISKKEHSWFRKQSQLDIVQAMLKANYYVPFRMAIENGNLAVINCVLNLAPLYLISVHDMLTRNECALFLRLFESGNLDMINHVLTIATLHRVDLKHVLERLDLLVICSAVESGRVEVFDRLQEVAQISRVGTEFMKHLERHRRDWRLDVPLQKRLDRLLQKEQVRDMTIPTVSAISSIGFLSSTPGVIVPSDSANQNFSEELLDGLQQLMTDGLSPTRSC